MGVKGGRIGLWYLHGQVNWPMFYEIELHNAAKDFLFGELKDHYLFLDGDKDVTTERRGKMKGPMVGKWYFNLPGDVSKFGFVDWPLLRDFDRFEVAKDYLFGKPIRSDALLLIRKVV